MVEEKVKVWAAGFFDGEGSAIVSETDPGNYQLLICVVNTDKRPINIFADNWAHFDGNEPLHNGWRRTRWVIQPRRGDKKEAYQVIFDYIDGERLLRDLCPYLVVKKEQADLVLRSILSIRFHPNRTIATVLYPYYKEYRALVGKRP